MRDNLVQPQGSTIGLLPTGKSIDDHFNNSFGISILDYLPDGYSNVTGTFASAQASGFDFLPYINLAINDAANTGRMLYFPSGYYPVSDTVKQINNANVTGNPKKTFIIPTTTFPANKFLWVWPIRAAAPQKYITGMGFQGASGHGDINAPIIGGFAIKSGNWHSTVSDVTISNCFYGGLYINPQHPTGSSGVSDCVNLKIDHIWVLDGGSISYKHCLEVDLDTTDSDLIYYEGTDTPTSFTTGNWTDGQLSNLDLSCSDSDPKNHASAGPYALYIHGASRTMFNVLLQRIFTATRMQTHIYLKIPQLNNCQFSNFSGETHGGVSGIDTFTGTGDYSVYQVDIVNAGQWCSFDNFYANGSLNNNGLHIGTASNLTFFNMTIDINYPNGQLKDNTTLYPKKITIDSTAKNISFINCNIRGFEDTLWNITYFQYRDIFTYSITDNGFNTRWDSPQMSSFVPTFKGLDFFTSVSGSNSLTNGSVYTTVKPTFSQNSDLSLVAKLTAASDGSTQECNWIYPLANIAPNDQSRYFLTLRYTVNTGVVGTHYIKVQMFDKVYQIPISSVGEESQIFINFPYSATSKNQLFAIMLGSSSSVTTDFQITISDIILNNIGYAYIPNYSTAVSGYSKVIALNGNNAWTGTNVFNNPNIFVGRDLNGNSVGLNLGSQVTPGTAYQDFFSAGSNVQGGRIQVTGGGSSPYSGTMSLYAGQLNLGALLLPNKDSNYDIGTSALKFRHGYFSDGLSIGGNQVPSINASVPATASATGTVGQIAMDTGFIYICVATNTWLRSPLSTW